MSAQSLEYADEGPRSKRAAILAAAIEFFGEVGYEATKWSKVADRVGIGQTALYHYFESKAHCLLTIMRIGLSRSESAFREATEMAPTATEALCAAVRSAYALSPQEALQNRILQANLALLAAPRSSAREETERQACRDLVSAVERDWAGLVERGIAAEEFPERDSILAARLLLGMVVSVWRWYRPDGPQSLDEIADFVAAASVRMVVSQG